VKYRPHRFHILDAIDYTVAKAKTTEELNDVRARYVDASNVSSGFTIPVDLDPDGKQRRQVFVDALNRLIQTTSQPKQPPPVPQPPPTPQPQPASPQQPAPQPSIPTPKAPA